MNEFPIVPEVRAEIKLFGNIFLKDVLMIGVVVGVAFILSQLFPTEQAVEQAIFMVCSGVLALYLDLRPSTNPSKRNYEVIWMLLTNRKPKLYKSMGYYEFTSKQELR